MDQKKEYDDVLSSANDDTTSEEKYVTYDELTRRLEEMRQVIQGIEKQSEKAVEPEPESQFESKLEAEPVLEKELISQEESKEKIPADRQAEQILKEAQAQARKIKESAVIEKNKFLAKMKEIERSEVMQGQPSITITVSKVALIAIVLLFIVSSSISRSRRCKR